MQNACDISVKSELSKNVPKKKQMNAESDSKTPLGNGLIHFSNDESMENGKRGNQY